MDRKTKMFLNSILVVTFCLKDVHVWQIRFCCAAYALNGVHFQNNDVFYHTSRKRHEYNDLDKLVSLSLSVFFNSKGTTRCTCAKLAWVFISSKFLARFDCRDGLLRLLLLLLQVDRIALQHSLGRKIGLSQACTTMCAILISGIQTPASPVGLYRKITRLILPFKSCQIRASHSSVVIA